MACLICDSEKALNRISSPTRATTRPLASTIPTTSSSVLSVKVSGQMSKCCPPGTITRSLTRMASSIFTLSYLRGEGRDCSVEIELLAEEAPITFNNFMYLAQGGVLPRSDLIALMV